MTDTTKLRELLAALPLVAWSKTRSTVAIPETEDFAGKDLHITGLDKQYARNLAAYISAVNPATVSALLDEIDRLRTRLEIEHAAPEWDGIACRDETIRVQGREIDRLRAALKVAEVQVRADREGLLLCHALSDGAIPEDDQLGRDGLAEYDEVLETITAALGSGTGDNT